MFAHRNSRNNYVILVDEHKMHIPDEFFGTKKFQEKVSNAQNKQIKIENQSDICDIFRARSSTYKVFQNEARKQVVQVGAHQ